MKILINLALISGLILSACGKKISITKRKYQSGYYVSHNHKKARVKNKSPQVSTQLTKPKGLMPGVEKMQSEIAPIPEKELRFTAVAAAPVKAWHKFIMDGTQKNDFGLAANPFNARLPLNIKPLQLTNQQFKTTQKSGLVSDVLSLFWIVILIILLFYLVALLLGGLGLGGFIHIFFLVALILFILWLLRIL